MYKITCTDPRWVDKKYNDVNFKAVGYTEDKAVANKFANS